MHRSRLRRIAGQLAGPLDRKDPASISRAVLFRNELRKALKTGMKNEKTVPGTSTKPTNPKKEKPPRTRPLVPRIRGIKKSFALSDKRLFRLAGLINDRLVNDRYNVKGTFAHLKMSVRRLEQRPEPWFFLPVIPGLKIPMMHLVKTPRGVVWIHDFLNSERWMGAPKEIVEGLRFAKEMAKEKILSKPGVKIAKITVPLQGKNAGEIFFMIQEGRVIPVDRPLLSGNFFPRTEEIV